MADNVLEIKFTGDGTLPGERAGQPTGQSYANASPANPVGDFRPQPFSVPRRPEADKPTRSMDVPYRLEQAPGLTKDPRVLRDTYKLADDPVQEKTREEMAAHELEMRKQREEWVHNKIIADMPRNLEKYHENKRKEAEAEERVERRKNLIRYATIGASVGAGIKAFSQIINDNIEIGKKMTSGDVMGAELQKMQQPFRAVSSAANIVPIIGPAVAGIVDGISDIFTASRRKFMAEDQAFRQESARLSMYSPAVAQAEGRAQEREVRTSLLESQAIGGKLGKLTELQSQLDATLKLQSLLEKMDKIDGQIDKTDSQIKSRIARMEFENDSNTALGWWKTDEERAKQKELIDGFKEAIGEALTEWWKDAANGFKRAAEEALHGGPFHLEKPDASWGSAAHKNGVSVTDRSRLNQPVLGLAGMGG